MRGGVLVAVTLTALTGAVLVPPPAPARAAVAPAPAQTPRGPAPDASGLTIGSHVRVGGRLLAGAPALPGDEVQLFGALPTRYPRTVVLQRFAAGAWRDVARGTARARWRLSVRAPEPGGYTYRAVAPAVGTSSALVSREHRVQVVAAVVTMAPPPRGQVGRLRRLTGTATPARPGRAVQLLELVDLRRTGGPAASWVPIAQTREDAAGRFLVQVPAGGVGRHRYRAAAADATGGFAFRSLAREAPTSRGPAASAYLAGVTPLLTRLPEEAGAPAYTVTSIVADGRTRPRSLHTSAHLVSYDVQGFAALATSLTLLPVRRGVMHGGGRLVEVRVDGRLRLRRFVTDGRVRPLVLDVRGARQVQLRSHDRGTLERGPGSDVVLLTPVLTTVARPEIGVDAGTSLSELPALGRSAGVSTGQVVGEPSAGLLGGSVSLRGLADAGTSGSVSFALGGRFRTLAGVPTLSGRTSAGLRGRVLVYGDDRLLTTLDALAAPPVRRTMNVTGVRSLRLQLVADRPQRAWAPAWAVTLADPRLS